MSQQRQASRSFSPTDPRVRWIGRTAAHKHEVRLAWSGSGFVARFVGTGLSAIFADPGNLFTVIVDGGAPRILQLTAEHSRYELASQLTYAPHQVEVYRRTEPMLGPTTCRGLLAPELLPVRARPRQMEVVGDSISCGYGNEGEHADLPYSPDTENHYLSYGALIARALGAELSTIAWSGRGVVRNYEDQSALLMPQLYARTLPDEDTAWPFADSQDLVLVNLGTNDFAREPGPDETQFVEAYVTLLSTVRQHRARAVIVATFGPMLETSRRLRAQYCIEQAVRVRQGRGDKRVFFHPLTTPNEFPGANEHPSTATHARMASELLPVIRTLIT